MASKWEWACGKSLIVYLCLYWILTGCTVSSSVVPITPSPPADSRPSPPATYTPLLPASRALDSERDLLLSNYPRLFDAGVIIVIGGNASQSEQESAQIIAAGLKELNGSEPVIVDDDNLGEDHKMGHNLILIGLPGSNDILGDVIDLTGATRVTSVYPGGKKGVLEVLTNPWDLEKSLLIVAGSDEWGVKAGAAALAHYQAFNERSVSVEWEEPDQTMSPYLGKTDAALDLLLSLRGEDEVPAEMREIVESDTVSVSINFSHALTREEIQSLEESGLRFVRISGEVAHSGTIYGAEVPWDKIEELLTLESVIRVESTWQQGIHSPDN